MKRSRWRIQVEYYQNSEDELKSVAVFFYTSRKIHLPTINLLKEVLAEFKKLEGNEIFISRTSGLTKIC